MGKMTITERKIKETLMCDSENPLFINISCPVFDGGNDACSNRLNKYYSTGLDSFYEYLKKHAPDIAKSKKSTKPPGISMKSTVSFLSEKHISIITDIDKFDGVEKTTLRLFDNYTLPDCGKLRAKALFSFDKSTKQKIQSVICEKIRERDGGFRYIPGAENVAMKKFQKNNFFLTSKGICFYYDKNILTQDASVYPCYVIPFDTLGIELDKM